MIRGSIVLYEKITNDLYSNSPEWPTPGRQQTRIDKLIRQANQASSYVFYIGARHNREATIPRKAKKQGLRSSSNLAYMQHKSGFQSQPPRLCGSRLRRHCSPLACLCRKGCRRCQWPRSVCRSGTCTYLLQGNKNKPIGVILLTCICRSLHQQWRKRDNKVV